MDETNRTAKHDDHTETGSNSSGFFGRHFQPAVTPKSPEFQIAVKFDFPREEAIELIKYLKTKL